MHKQFLWFCMILGSCLNLLCNDDDNNNYNNNISIYPLSHLSGRSGHQKPPKISREYRFIWKHLKSGAESNTISNMSRSMQIARTRSLTSGNRVVFPLMESNPTDRIDEGLPACRCWEVWLTFRNPVSYIGDRHKIIL